MAHKNSCLRSRCCGTGFTRRNCSTILGTASLVKRKEGNFEFRALFYVPLEKSSSVVRFGGKEEVGAACCLLMLLR